MQIENSDLIQLDTGALRRLREQDPVALERLASRLLDDLRQERGATPAEPADAPVNAELLLASSILEGCSRSQVARLLNHAERRDLRSGDALYAAGEKADKVYLIETGALTLHQPGAAIEIPQGTLIGLDGAVGHDTYQDTVLASADSALLAIPVEAFNGFAQENPAILKRLFRAFQDGYRELAPRIFHGCGRARITRLLADSQRRKLAAGEPIYTRGEQADRVYLLERGAAKMRRGGGAAGERRESVVGLDGVVGHETYQDTVLATEDTSLMVIPATALTGLAKDNPSVLKRLFLAHEGRYQDQTEVEKPVGKAKEPNDKGFALELAGWIIALLVPLTLYALAPRLGLGNNVLILIGIIVVSVVMWVFELVPSFVPSLFSILMIILLEVAPPKVALAGFSSNTFIMCLSVFGISALMIKSGLAYRMSLWLLRMAPPGRIWYGFALFLVGFLLTPVVPSKNGRVSIVQPFLLELLNLVDRRPKNDTATQYAMSATLGANLMSPIFLTGSSLNLMMFGLFDEQTRFTFNWIYWVMVASIPGLILLLGYILMMFFAFRKGAPVTLSRERLAEQSRVLGPMSPLETGTLIMLVCMIVLIPTVKFHKIDIPWLMLTISVILLMFGAIGKSEIKGGIDWPILLFIGSILAWPGVIDSAGLDNLITEMLRPVSWYMKNQFMLFIVLLSLAMVGLRFFLPINVAVVIFATILLPVATETGISPWVIGFTILMMAEASVFSYQDLQRVQMDGGLVQHGLSAAVNQRKANLLYLLLIFLRIGVILASIPIWYYLNIV